MKKSTLSLDTTYVSESRGQESSQNGDLARQEGSSAGGPGLWLCRRGWAFPGPRAP